MGADIHGFLERRLVGYGWYGVDNGWWLARDYGMFALLANVRGQGALYPPRGVPRDADMPVRRAYCMVVLETEADVDTFNRRRTTAAVTRREAQESTARGSCEWWDETHSFISNPEWHTPSWLTTAEVRQVVACYDAQHPEGQLDPLWRMLLGAMESGEAHGAAVRFIFWFAG